jgi:hypothetical protein
MTILIKSWEFLQAFGSDSDYHPLAMSTDAYLDRKSGAIRYAVIGELDPSIRCEYGEDYVDEILEDTHDVNANPDNFVRLPPMSHGEHHAIMQDFLESNWTVDAEQKTKVQDVYYPRKSIGYWIKNVSPDIAEKFFRHKEAEIQRRAEQFLRDNDVDFEWQ